MDIVFTFTVPDCIPILPHLKQFPLGRPCSHSTGPLCILRYASDTPSQSRVWHLWPLSGRAGVVFPNCTPTARDRPRPCAVPWRRLPGHPRKSPRSGEVGLDVAAQQRRHRLNHFSDGRLVQSETPLQPEQGWFDVDVHIVATQR